MNKRIGRRKFINYIGVVITAPFIALFYFLFKKEKSIFLNRQAIEIDLPRADGFYIFNSFFVFVNNKKFDVFSSKCTHLGCKLLEKNETELICPCHGSKFSKNGVVLEGPAGRDLTKLKYKVNFSSNKLIIYPES